MPACYRAHEHFGYRIEGRPGRVINGDDEERMIIKSMAGDFEIAISGFEVEGRQLVMIGTMGVWNARTYMTAREMLAVFGKMLRPSILLFLITIPFRAMAEGPGETDSADNEPGGTS